MANATVAAGNNGVAGTATALPAAALTGTLPGGATDGTAGNTTALRFSVSQTGGSVSTVFSETQGLRFAYSGVEADSPEVTRTA